MKNKRFPNYPDDTDYTTNAPSYYDDLARKQKLIELLAKKIWEYEETLDLTLEEISNRLESYIDENDNLMTDRLEQWDLNLEKFPENVELLLQEWLSDGTLDHIINDTIFNWKLDTSIFEQFRDSTTTQLAQMVVNVKTYKNDDGTFVTGDGIQDDTTGVQRALDENKAIYFPEGVYKVGVKVSNQSLYGFNRHTTYLKPNVPGGFSLTIVENGVWHGTQIENLSFSGGYSGSTVRGGAVRFGHENYVSGDENAGGVRFKNCNFVDSDKAIVKNYGNIGNYFENCGFTNANYHIYVDKIPYQSQVNENMHSGDDTFVKCHFSFSKKASYYFNDNVRPDKIVFDDCIFEGNRGFNLFVKLNDVRHTHPESIILQNCHMENSALDEFVILDDTKQYKTYYIHLENIRSFVISNSQVSRLNLINSSVYSDHASPTTIIDKDNNSVYYANNPSSVMYQDDNYVPMFLGSTRTGADPAAVITKPRAMLSQSDSTHIFSESFDGLPVSFAGDTTLKTEKVRDGLLFGSSSELTLPSTTTNYNFITGKTYPANKWIVTTIDMKQVGDNVMNEISIRGNNSFLMRHVQTILNKYKNNWVSLVSIVPPSDTSDAVRMFLTPSGVSSKIRMSAFQVHAFDTLSEAVRFTDSQIYATNNNDVNGRPVITYGNGEPTTGTWRKGDVVLDIEPVAGQTSAWICIYSGSPGTWQPLSQTGYRSTGGIPTFTPNYIGEEAYDGTGKNWYKATGLTSSDWKAITGV